ncbi:MAG: hypothetical protein K2O56_05115 [Muribaculaceae bacterium]|nr:hypothetical protein [Muribaculaceae bacterium]
MYRKLSTIFAGLAISLSAVAGDMDVNDGIWNITFDNSSKTISYNRNGSALVKGAYVSATTPDGEILESTSYPTVNLKKESVSDGFGSGTKYTYVYSGLSGKNNLEQSVYIYQNVPYILVEASVDAGSGTAAAVEICPIVSKTSVTLPLPSSNNRIYDMPFANDNWATFSTTPWNVSQPLTSCEATAMFNVSNRNGLVIGSVDHSVWKSAVIVTPNGTNRVRNLKAQAGYISKRTWDIVDNKASSTRHGEVRGSKVDSPRFMLGWFEDWRTGLETYGEANTVLCPKYEWTEDESLFGWQSWGGMEWGLNYNSAMSLLEFFEKELKPVGFHNKKGRCHIVLDSGWNALDDNQLRKFADKCKELGFVAGIYDTPFSYWGTEDDCKNNNTWEGGNLGEMVLKANGRYRQINGMSLDPTHPAVKEFIRQKYQKFRNLGFGFLKIDFMNNGSQEADSWYDPNITTGMMAYNYGMDYIKEYAGDMMLDFSIAPVFPAKAHVRRIGCDAWGDLPQSMYTLNCINGSWWLDRVYAFNDPDHMCLSKVTFSGKGSNDEQEARIRYSCGLLTGMMLLGGTYAYEGDVVNNYGHVVGTDAERARAVKFASNKDLTLLGQVGRSFRPVEGTFNYKNSLFSKDDVSCDNEFVLDTPDAFYYAVFNYGTDGSGVLSKDVDFERLGINPASFVNVTELWSGEKSTPANLKVNVPVKDVKIYRFEKPGFGGDGSSVAEIGDANTEIIITGVPGGLQVKASGTPVLAEAYTIDGILLDRCQDSGSEIVELNFTVSGSPVIVHVVTADGHSVTRKIIPY